MATSRRCARCARPSSKLRRGLCGACYQRERRGSPAGRAGAVCVACGEQDVRLLRSVRVGGELVCACRNHGWLADHTEPRPETVAGFVALCRQPGDRRRRGGDRRTSSCSTSELSRRASDAAADPNASSPVAVEEPAEELLELLHRWAG